MAIVVGIDGSKESAAAFRFALEEARIRDVGVRAVAAWHVPAVAYAGGAYAPSVDLGEGIEAEAKQRLEEVVGGEESPGVEVETAVRQGQPAQVLLEEAKGAELLVVGSRGLGGFRGLLLGSVSQQCAQHSPCPMTILPRQMDADRDAPGR
jgi:nucleotide-binding universal stress UspA family protein